MNPLPTRSLNPTGNLVARFPVYRGVAKVLAVGIAVITVSSHFALATSATWDGTASSLWSDTINWDAAGVDPSTVPGATETATFNNAGNGNTTIDVGLALPIGNILFDTASVAAYTIGSAVAGAQTLSLDGLSPITINATVTQGQLINANLVLGTAAVATYQFTNSSTTSSLTVAGTIQGGTGGTAGQKVLNVSGAGATNFTNAITPGGATNIAVRNISTGNLTLSGNVTSNLFDLRATAGGTVTVNGQTITVSAQSNYGGSSTFGKYVQTSGNVAFNGGIQSATSSGALAGADGMAFIVNGGAFSASFVALGRTNNMGNVFFTTSQNLSTNGFQVNGGAANVTGTLNIAGSNSSASGQVTGTGALSVGGEFIIGQNGGGRTNFFQVTGGTLTVNDSTNGISIAKGTPAVSARGQLLLTGGTTTTEKITFGLSGGLAGSVGDLTLNGANASIYIGSGGVVKAATNAYTESINLLNGTLGAKANWSSALSMNLNGAGVTIKAADAADVARDISLSGVVGGSNGFSKAGAGTLALTNAINTYSGATNVNAGTLLVSGSIAGSATTVNDAGAFGAGSAASTIGIATTGAFSLVDTAEFLLDINIANSSSATSDLVNVGNLTLDIDNSAVLSLANLGSNLTLDPGVALPFIDYSGTWNGGTFAGLADDSTFSVGTNTFRISYNGVNENDTAVVLVAVPEPASAALLLGGIGCLIGMRRPARRRIS